MEVEAANTSILAAASYDDWSFVANVAVFQRSSDVSETVRALDLPDHPRLLAIPGVALRAARTMLGLSQVRLAGIVGCAKLTLNNVENGLVRPSDELAVRIRVALEKNGSRFVSGGGTLGVVVVSPRQDLAKASRSPTVRNKADTEAFAVPPVKRRGRPSRD